MWPPEQQGNLYYKNRRDIQAKYTPSRGEYNEYFANLSASIWTDFRLPDFASFMGPLSELMEAFDNVMI